MIVVHPNPDGTWPPRPETDEPVMWDPAQAEAEPDVRHSDEAEAHVA